RTHHREQVRECHLKKLDLVLVHRATPQSAIPFEREFVVIVSIRLPSAKTRTARSARTIIVRAFIMKTP
ncbi:MAG: hypothetical protein NTX09_09300, partial [Verrucomicrobia bacterium]|nr:hypothetical protein [Verrucomicrobiota bacterium]